jgi:hypothetical protein
MKKIKNYFKRIYRLSLSFKRQEELVWKEIKALHAASGWKYMINEKEKYIETFFEISKDTVVSFYYMIYDGCFHFRVKILENFPSSLTTEMFILAEHFNNLMNHGVVIVNVNGKYVEYQQKRDLIIPLLFNDEAYIQLIRHYSTSKDIYSAFQRLVTEQEAPVIIIADLLKKIEQDKEDNV